MKKLVIATAILLGGMMAASALAAAEVSGVSPEQIEIVTQKEEARQRRDEMLLKRAATIKAAQKKGNRLGQQKLK